ncbi:MAG: redoxin domain-containing protein [Gemmatimonadetes bacterium]|nr:redoxin domain-containing protein [Gemmatimonadota bacterium]MBT8478669.1 redoxin domain-containing protein [Gemmatimonadota bacterium]NNK48497.1 redoxin domain-containing protein [Gemmatimonadota bacterium]
MSLGRRLKAIADGLSAKAPEASAALHGYIEDLRATGIEDRVLKVGDEAPDFELESTAGGMVSLDALVTQGPVILTFYRGRW